MDLSPGGTAADFDGLDRFGRVTKLQWRDYGASATAAYIYHGYDYAGNRTWRRDSRSYGNDVDQDELYTYDGLNQLIYMQRGRLLHGPQFSPPPALWQLSSPPLLHGRRWSTLQN
jgi:hypothetical protein